LNSIFGKSLFINRYKHWIKDSTNLAQALKKCNTANSRDWFRNAVEIHQVALVKNATNLNKRCKRKVKKNQVSQSCDSSVLCDSDSSSVSDSCSDSDVTDSLNTSYKVSSQGSQSGYKLPVGLFLIKSRKAVPKVSPLQLAASVLSGSKHYMSRGYVLLRYLFGNQLRVLYSDTDSIHCALSRPSLLLSERQDIPESEKRKIRRLLFGFSEAQLAYSLNPGTRKLFDSNGQLVPDHVKPLSGTFKIEQDDIEESVYIALKCYYLSKRNNQSKPEIKAKSISGSELISKEMMQNTSMANSLIRETRVRLMPNRKGVTVVKATKKMGLHRSSVQYKFQYLPGGDVRAFL